MDFDDSFAVCFVRDFGGGGGGGGGRFLMLFPEDGAESNRGMGALLSFGFVSV